MRVSTTFIPSLVNLLFVFSIVTFLLKAFGKKKEKDKQPTQRIENKTQPKEITIHRTSYSQRPQSSPKPVINDSLQLKRCPNCGGEIPQFMMKCEICGTKQPGCGVVVWIFIVIIALFIASLFAQGNGVPVAKYFSEFLYFLSEM